MASTGQGYGLQPTELIETLQDQGRYKMEGRRQVH